MFNNNYDRNSLNNFNNSKESQRGQINFKINNIIDFGRQSKNKFFGDINLFNQSHSNININRNLPEKINSSDKNLFLQNSQYKFRDSNYSNYTNFYRETNNQPYQINNNFQNIHNINTINNNFQNQNLFRYNDLNTQRNETNISNISNGFNNNNNNISSSQQRRSYSEMNRRSTPINQKIDTLQNNINLINGKPINYSNHNFYHGKNIINQEYNNIIPNNNKYNYNSSNNTINNFYDEMQKEKEKERKQKENYIDFWKKQIEEKKKRKEIEKQKEKEYDLKLEKQFQEYLKQQNELEKTTTKRPISNREKPITDIINDINNNNSKQNIKIISDNYSNDKIKNRTNYNNFNTEEINEESKTRNKRSTASESFINSGKGIIDSFSKQIKTIDEFKKDFNTPLNNNSINQNNINNINQIKEDKLGFTFKNKAETEEMIDKLIKETDDYLKGTLQQSFNDININKEKKEKEKNIYQILNKNKIPNEQIEFKGTFGINSNLQKTSQFYVPENTQMQHNIEMKKNLNNNITEIEPRRKIKEINDKNNIKNNNNKKEEENKKNDMINIDELLKGIDLKALNYHSKYEEVSEDKNKETIKNKENKNEEKEKMEESMKSFSKLVSSKSNNETWKKDSLEEKMNNNENIEENSNDKKEKEKDNKEETEKKKKIMDFLSNRKKDKKIKYKLKTDYSPSPNTEINNNFNTEAKQQAINSSIKLNGSLNPNLKITFGNGANNLLSNQSIKFNQEKSKNNNISNFTFGKNLENTFKNIKNNNNEESSEEDEEKYDIKVKNENEINYDDMLNKNDEIKFLDFDNFLDISKINKNNNDNEDDLCNIRYTAEEEKEQNKKVTEALKDAIDSSDEDELNKEKTNIEDKVNFSGGNTIGLNENNLNQNNKDNLFENNLNKEEDNDNMENSADNNDKKIKKEDDDEYESDFNDDNVNNNDDNENDDNE